MDDAPCSQVSLDQQAELDKKQEKAQLVERENQKRHLAKLLHEQQNSTCKKLTGKERLDFLLKQTELFTQFLIQQKSMSKDPELKALQAQFMKAQKEKNISARKRKSGKFGQDNENSNDGDETVAITRLE